MSTFTLELCPREAARLGAVAERMGVAPEEALLSHLKEWLEAQAPDVVEAGLMPAPPGLFPDDGCHYSFFNPAQADPARAEDYLTPEQRLNAVAEILATIALRVLQQEREHEATEPAEELG